MSRLDKIPAELIRLMGNHCIVFELSPDPTPEDPDHLKKKPLSAKNGRSEDWNLSENHVTFEEAVRYCEKNPNKYVPGVCPRESEVIALDIDHAFTEKGDLKEVALKLLQPYIDHDAYMERSICDGVHVYLQKSCPLTVEIDQDYSDGRPLGDGCSVAVYPAHGITVTGNNFGGSVIPEADPQELWRKHVYKKSDRRGVPAERKTYGKGHRSNHLISYAGKMASQSFSVEHVKALVLVENQENCNPPLDEREIMGTVFKSIPEFVRKHQEKPRGDIGLVIKHARGMIARNKSFLITPYLPENDLTLFVGDPGTSKSLVSLAIAAALTKGRKILGVQRDPMKVFFLSNEDANETSLWRFQQSGGNQDLLWFEDHSGEMFTLDQVASLEEHAREFQPKLIIIDSLMTHLGGKIDSYRANEVAAIMAPLIRIAENCQTTVLALMHLNKATTARVVHRVQGSVGFTGVARSVIAIDHDPDLEKPDSRILVHIKSNYSRLGMSQVLSVTDGKVTWQGESSLRPGDLFGADMTAEEDSQLRQAMDFLRQTLNDDPLPSSRNVERDARSQGISKITLGRAKAKLGIKSKKTATGWLYIRPANWDVTPKLPFANGGGNKAETNHPAPADAVEIEDKVDPLERSM